MEVDNWLDHHQLGAQLPKEHLKIEQNITLITLQAKQDKESVGTSMTRGVQ